MPDAQQPRPSAEPITAVIADRARSLREKAGLSQSDVAILMNRLGVPWKRATVVNLEKRSSGSRGAEAGGRDSVSVQELLALAQVLDVPPVMLIADPRTVEEVSIGHPGKPTPWKVLLWLIGAVNLEYTSSAWWHESSELIQLAVTLAEIEELLVKPPSFKKRLDGSIQKDAIQGKEEHEYLLFIANALARIVALGSPLPPIAPEVRERAEELGIKFPDSED